MKQIILAMALIVFTLTNVTAQEEEESKINTLFGSGETHHGGYGAAVLKVSSVNEDLALFVGGRGGWTINRTLTIGGGGYGLVTWPELEYQVDGETVIGDFMFGYGGLYLEYIHDAEEMIHFSVNTLIGAGGASIVDDWDWDSDREYHSEPWAAYFVIEPGIAVELNVTEFMRIGLEASYRYVNKVRSGRGFDDIEGASDMKLSNFSAGINFQFGCF